MTTVHKLSKRGGGVTAKIKTPITKTENRTTNSKKQIQVCFLGLLQFKQNPHLEKALIDTFPRILAEATPRGPLWGIGLGLSDPLIRNRNTWRGEIGWGTYLRTSGIRLWKRRECFPRWPVELRMRTKVVIKNRSCGHTNLCSWQMYKVFIRAVLINSLFGFSFLHIFNFYHFTSIITKSLTY